MLACCRDCCGRGLDRPPGGRLYGCVAATPRVLVGAAIFFGGSLLWPALCLVSVGCVVWGFCGSGARGVGQAWTAERSSGVEGLVGVMDLNGPRAFLLLLVALALSRLPAPL